MKHVAHAVCGRHQRLCLLALLVCLQAGICEARNRLSDIRYWSSPTGTRIVLDLGADARYDSFTLKNPDRLVVDLKEFDLAAPQKVLTINDGIVTVVRLSAAGKADIRVVIGLAKKTNHSIFPLQKIQDKPPRLVIDITCPELETSGRAEREQTRQRESHGNYIVALDPGHGGEDPGAVSRNGAHEKDLVLALARRLQTKLNQQQGIRAYLTRRGDYFIPLQERVRIAQQYGANLFLSIHVDSSFSQRTSGSSVYCLSFKGASDNAARTVAAKENSSDSIGGVPLDKQDSDLNTIIVDLVQTHSLNSGLRFAGVILREIAQINKVHTPKPRQANFVVLNAPDIPSVLIETDFISNPRSEKKLRTDAFQNAFAARLAAAVAAFAPAQRIRTATLVADQKGAQYHVVHKGETMTTIARAYGITLKALCAANRLKPTALLRAGARLNIPGERKAPPAAPEPTYHVVRKGETLTSIAAQYNLSANRLQDLNELSAASTLMTGTKLLIP